jgi:hypothetical protein
VDLLRGLSALLLLQSLLPVRENDVGQRINRSPGQNPKPLLGEIRVDASDGGMAGRPAHDIKVEWVQWDSFCFRMETGDAVIRFRGSLVHGAPRARLAGTFEATAGGRIDAFRPAGKRLSEGTWELVRGERRSGSGGSGSRLPGM